MLAPIYTLTVDGADITATVAPRLLSLRITDRRGMEADTLDLDLCDHDGLLRLPRKGARVLLALGFARAEAAAADGAATALWTAGEYLVDEIEHTGTPDVLTIRARAADLEGPLTAKRAGSWHDTTLGAVLGDIAARNGLTLAAAQDLTNRPIGHLDQSDESDVHLLTRLSEEHDAVATVKRARLLFTPRGRAASISGAALPPLAITRRAGENHRYAETTRDAFSGVVAEWQDIAAGERRQAIAGAAGEGDNPKRLRGTYATETDALQAASAEWARIQRGTAEFELDLAVARLDIGPESPLTVSGYKARIDAAAWIITEATHSLSPTGGLTTSIRAERAGAD
jgi:uncharacterized protein